ncbi:AAA family ATPase [Gracilimonas sp.]|uniref:ATP-dependent endonuclease n=1 Tax=Gracilimonas sp. TaxID=1974203 RepID=UPI0032EF9B48
MRIEFLEIENFRKLKSCRISFSEKETIFVGANNSGKTSAMDALITFLKDKSRFKTKDITLSNWGEINAIGNSWVKQDEEDEPNLSIDKWRNLLPKMDIWLHVEDDEIHHVNELIPTLKWRGGLLGVRLIYEPKDLEKFFKDFRSNYLKAKETKEASQKKLKLWPYSMWDFLEKKKFESLFTIKAYKLNPGAIEEPDQGVAQLQSIQEDMEPIEGNPFHGLIKIDIVNAQRGFSDPNDTFANYGSLSKQLRDYFSKHLNPTDQPTESDLKALEAIEEAKDVFDETLKTSFHKSLDELEGLNYPGFGNPSITISTLIKPIDSLDHNSAVQFSLLKEGEQDDDPLSLPEVYNGLGYQNLISMVFKLIRFRDEWMKTGKAETTEFDTADEITYEPLHLVLVEEPEAHLHAQVQQVFIRKAFEVLRNDENLGKKTQFSTQLIVSTHSNHIAHESDFGALRYFKRILAKDEKSVPTSVVIDISRAFGTEDETRKFAVRYLKTTHCDLFFADAVIMVEGSAEKMLLPHFIEQNFPNLNTSYISLLEIGGSHAHRLRPLIENLGIITLIITDLDASKDGSAVVPKVGDGQITGNKTIKDWLPKKEGLDDLIELEQEAKLSDDKKIMAAFQVPVSIKLNEDAQKVVPYTFEDALAYENIDLFNSLDGVGLITKFKEAFKLDDLEECATQLFKDLRKGQKAKLALDLLFLKDPSELRVPEYIKVGLKWLEEELNNQKFMTDKVIADGADEND